MEQEIKENPAETYHAYLGPALFVPCAGRVLGAAALRPGEAAVPIGRLREFR